MHKNTRDESISPQTAAWRLMGVHAWVIEGTRHYWRKVWKRNRGKKVKSLRTHRKGR